MEVCETPLYWERLNCDVYQKQEIFEQEIAEGKFEKGEEEPWLDLSFLRLPAYVVIPVQILSSIFELGVVFTVSLPWYLLLTTIAAIDWVLDWVFIGLFGLFCMPCAGIFIWILNIAFIPFWLAGEIQRFFLETLGLLIDGWMLFMGGSGCYLYFGKDCWYNKAPWNDDLRGVLDIPWLMADPTINTTEQSVFSKVKTVLNIPTTENLSDILAVRRSNRKENLLNSIPLFAMISTAMDPFFEQLFDF